MTTLRTADARNEATVAPIAAPSPEETGWSRRHLLDLDDFTSDEVDYLRGLPQFARVSRDFFDYLRTFRFTGDLFAVPEGTPLFAGEPLLTLRAPVAVNS